MPAGRHRWRLPDAYARVGTDAWLLGLWLAVARGVALDEGKGGDGEGEEEEEEEGEGRWALVKKAGEECAAGVRVEMVVAVGRKGGLV